MSDQAEAQWVPVDLGDAEVHGVVWGWDRAWAYGHGRGPGDGGPFVASVTDGGEIGFLRIPSTGRVSSVMQDGEGLGLCVGESPAEVVFVDGRLQQPRATERDEDFLQGTHAWITMGDEDPYYVAEWEDGRLTAGEPWHEDYPEGPGLRHRGVDGELIVGSSDAAPFVAGLLSEGDAPPVVGLWSCVADQGPNYPSGWQAVPLDPAPDGFTQITSSSAPEFVGHREGRPLVFLHRHGQIETPDVPLDPDHPMVLFTTAGSLALQSLGEGPQLWTRNDVGWAPQSLPPGRLDAAAVCTTSELVWLVIGGRLWRPTPTRP